SSIRNYPIYSGIRGILGNGIHRIGSAGREEPMNGGVNCPAGAHTNLKFVNCMIGSTEYCPISPSDVVGRGSHRGPSVVIDHVTPSIPACVRLSDALSGLPVGIVSKSSQVAPSAAAGISRVVAHQRGTSGTTVRIVPAVNVGIVASHRSRLNCHRIASQRYGSPIWVASNARGDGDLTNGEVQSIRNVEVSGAI